MSDEVTGNSTPSGLAVGKVVLVTGAGSGIGRATAELFAAEGATVVVAADIDAEAAEHTAAAIAEAGGRAEPAHVDVADPASVAALVDGVVTRHDRLDAAHNNAGIRGIAGAFHELDYHDWSRMIAVNLTGVFLCMQRELAVMAATGAGSIVNTASGAGVVGFPGLPHYVAAKHGVVGLTKTAALEYARRGIRVNAVLPGVVDTPMVRDADGEPSLPRPLPPPPVASPRAPDRLRGLSRTVGRGSLGTAAEIAEAVVWLCSDRASFVSGESMLVDGATICR